MVGVGGVGGGGGVGSTLYHEKDQLLRLVTSLHASRGWGGGGGRRNNVQYKFPILYAHTNTPTHMHKPTHTCTHTHHKHSHTNTHMHSHYETRIQLYMCLCDTIIRPTELRIVRGVNPTIWEWGGSERTKEVSSTSENGRMCMQRNINHKASTLRLN